MADVNFELVTPEALLFSGPADMVVVPGTEGDFGVLPGHAPLMSTIRPGFIAIHKGNNIERVFVSGGFADVNPAGLTVLADEAMPEVKVTGDVVDRLIGTVSADLGRAGGDTPAARQKLADLQFLRGALKL